MKTLKGNLSRCAQCVVLIFLFSFLSAKGICDASLGIEKNLIHNSDFFLDIDSDGCPDGWGHGKSREGNFTASRFGCVDFDGRGNKSIWVEGGTDREGEWFCSIDGIEPDRGYLFTFWAYRQVFLNKIYPDVEIMGENFHLNNHCTVKGWQYFELPLRSGPGMLSTTLRFINNFPLRFYFRQPRLIPVYGEREIPIPPLPNMASIAGIDIFPIGIFGGSISDMKKIKEAGFNTVLIDPQREKVECASQLGLKVILSICGEGDRSETVKYFRDHPSLMGWYIADEPELKSITPEILRAKLDRDTAKDPAHPACMAILRSGFIRAYRDSCHIFMLDQYPIPNQPVTWLSDSLDEASREVGQNRVWAVIQAFGGEEYVKKGWPQYPSFEEIKTLSFLALIHQTKGLFYYSFRDSIASGERWERLKRVAGELNGLYDWLRLPAEESTDLTITIQSSYKADAGGRPAVHYQLKKNRGEALLIMANTIDKEVEISLDGLPKHLKEAHVLYEERILAVKEGNLRDIFRPHQTHIYLMRDFVHDTVTSQYVMGNMPFDQIRAQFPGDIEQLHDIHRKSPCLHLTSPFQESAFKDVLPDVRGLLTVF